MTLDTLDIGAAARVERVRGGRTVAQRLQEMGLTTGVTVKVIRVAPLGDPLEIELRGYRLSLRKDEAAAVEVSLP
ncbi:MAG: ferrous iron transport protein A [Chloracidobacterium sp.]|uniref:Ferrous iron transport protein A n=1 Tax=Chloracidobacterium validum TaxID=2821543 RepID=A0ABX8BBQ1_9BACT|nr:ferrous iron transport protein A [Chloracidobacterium validum]QUW04263.1 ferrous iron transport protein A [Chloracidobacterium validum]